MALQPHSQISDSISGSPSREIQALAGRARF
jgi:hypothetical protein